MYAKLSQEPWCLTPDAIADLTDLQILELYLRPASQRPGESKAGDDAPAVDPFQGGIPSRREFVTGATADGRTTTAEANRLYDHLLRERAAKDAAKPEPRPG